MNEILDYSMRMHIFPFTLGMGFVVIYWLFVIIGAADTSSLDIDFDVDVDQVKVSSGDKILICSDGVTNMVDLEEIEQLCNTLEPENLIHTLIDLANQNGGLDNSTAVCVQII